MGESPPLLVVEDLENVFLHPPRRHQSGL